MRVAVLFMFLMSVASFALINGTTPKHPIPVPLKGGMIPDFFTLALDNETEFTREILKEEIKKTGARRVALSFFATWCENCKTEFKLMQNNVARLEANGVQVYLINVGEKILKDGQKVGTFVEKFAGSSFPFYFDPNVNLLKNFGLISKNATTFELPIIIVLDENLKVIGILKEIGKDFPQVLWGEF